MDATQEITKILQQSLWNNLFIPFVLIVTATIIPCVMISIIARLLKNLIRFRRHKRILRKHTNEPKQKPLEEKINQEPITIYNTPRLTDTQKRTQESQPVQSARRVQNVKRECTHIYQESTDEASRTQTRYVVQVEQQRKPSPPQPEYAHIHGESTDEASRTQTKYVAQVEQQRRPFPQQPVYTQEEQEQHKQRIAEIGAEGERVSNFYALPIVAYGKQLRNIYIPMPNGETTEIDTVVITVSGIYVIETKNYSGKIYGNEEDQNWTAWYSERKKFRFYNPIKQNEAHIWALKQILYGLNEDCYFSVITFSDNCALQKVEYDKTKTIIVQQGQLTEVFKELLKENEGKISRQDVNKAFEQLKQYTDAPQEVKQKHVANIQKKKRIAATYNYPMH